MRKLSQITESIWSDIHKRSNGIQVKREDDVNRMDFNTFYDYLELKYKDKYVHISKSITWLCVTLDDPIRLIAHYNSNKIDDITIEPFDENSFSNAKTFIENFKLVYKSNGEFEIKDRNNIVSNETVDKFIEFYYNNIISDDEFNILNTYCKMFTKTITNDANITCDKFIDFLLNQLKKHGDLKPVKIVDFVTYNWDDILKLIKQESKGLEESVWADIHKRSNGVQVRKEDDINHLDQDELFNYIQEHYICTSYSFSNHHQPRYDENEIHIPFLIPEISSYAYNATLMFGKTGCVVTFNKDMKWECPEVYKLIKDNYEISDALHNEFLFSIYPLNGSKKITNKFFIDVLDLLIDNIEVTDKQELILKRK